jgi:hypothetical protein
MVPKCEQQLGRVIAERSSSRKDTENELADDLLHGADDIAAFIFGTRENRHKNRRKVYYLAECSRLPVFRLGSMLCARRSVLLNWIAAQEGRVAPSVRMK